MILNGPKGHVQRLKDDASRLGRVRIETERSIDRAFREVGVGDDGLRKDLQDSMDRAFKEAADVPKEGLEATLDRFSVRFIVRVIDALDVAERRTSITTHENSMILSALVRKMTELKNARESL